MYAEAKGWTVVTVYHLEGVLGKSVMNHPEAKRMLEDARDVWHWQRARSRQKHILLRVAVVVG
jgi:hypothetical protein